MEVPYAGLVSPVYAGTLWSRPLFTFFGNISVSIDVYSVIIRHDVFKLIVSVLVVIILIYSYYRTFSRNHYQRYRENEWYLRHHNRVKCFFSRERNNMQQRKTHRIFRCPNCGQSIRVPKGKGKIAITCPMCKTEFIKKS